MSAQAIMTLVLFLAVIVLLIWQPVSPIVIGAGIPVILAVFNVVEPSKAFSQFSNTTVILLAAQSLRQVSPISLERKSSIF